MALLIGVTIRAATPGELQAYDAARVGGAFGPWNLDALIFGGSVGRALGAWLGLPVILVLSHNLPAARRIGWPAYLAAHCVGFALFSLTWCSTASGVRALAAAITDLPFPDVPLGYEVSFEFQRLTGVYVGTVAFTGALTGLRQSHAARRHATKLQARAMESRLAALNARIEPHFLFNALNTLNSLMYDDPARARSLLADLAGLLRSTSEHSGELWSLSLERAHLARFVRFVHARFGDWFGVTSSICNEHDDVPVPRFCMQVLVENAVKHNQRAVGTLRIHVSERRVADHLEIAVSDNGQGFGSARLPVGGALDRLSEILRLAYGGLADLSITAWQSGDNCITQHLPLRVIR